MKTLKLGSSDAQVKDLCKFLGIAPRQTFDSGVKAEVLKFQKEKGLVADGIVGFNTWKALYLNSRNTRSLVDSDYAWAAKLLDVDLASLRAVLEVETGNKGGFVAEGKPVILFEGHVFWKELKKIGINPEKLRTGNSNILYPTWTREYYKSGLLEWERLEKARKINRGAADSSASWGIFQIMGNNYKAAGCNSVEEFVRLNTKGELEQLLLGITFIRNNSTLLNALRNKDWTTFARIYNGSGQVEAYANKLRISYKKYLI